MKTQGQMHNATTEQPESGTNDAAPTRWLDLLDRQYLFATTTLCLGVALFAFNSFLVSTALPTAVEEFGGAALISWSLSLYLIFGIVSGAAAARIKQRFNARSALIGAALIFLFGTLLAATASSMPQVLLGRVFQGLGEGVISAICYTLIPEMFPSRLVSKVFGAEAVVWALAAFGGPVISGFLTQALSWRAAFLINVPIITLFIVLVALIVPRGDAAPAKVAFPALRLAAIAGGMLFVTLSGIIGNPLLAAAMVIAAAAIFAAAVMGDRAAAGKLFPDTAFSWLTPSGLGLWVVLLMPLAQSSTSVYLVYALQRLWGYAPLDAGAIGAVMALCWSASAIVVANFDSMRLHLLWVGPLLLILGLAGVLSTIRSQNLAGLLLSQATIGCAFGVSWGYLCQTLMEIAPDEQRDRTSALLPTVQSAGYAIGAALMGLAANSSGLRSSTLPADFDRAMLAVFICAIFIAIPALAAALRMAFAMLSASRPETPSSAIRQGEL